MYSMHRFSLKRSNSDEMFDDGRAYVYEIMCKFFQRFPLHGLLKQNKSFEELRFCFIYKIFSAHVIDIKEV